MTDTQETKAPEQAPVEQAPVENPQIEKARQEAVNRYKKEESLRLELEQTKREAQKLKEKVSMYEANGWDTSTIKDNKQPDTLSILQKQIEEMSNSLKASERRREEVEQLAHINEIVQSNDNFELVKAFNAQKTVQDLINLRKEKGQNITATEAAEMIESHLEKQTQELKANVSKTKKGKKLLNLDTIAETVDKDKKSEPQSSATQTSTKKREPVQAVHTKPWAGNIMASKDNLIKEISQKYSLKR